MSDQHPASTSDARKRLRCGLCGEPARGYATIGDTRYCHEGDDPTCYQKAQKAPAHTVAVRGPQIGSSGLDLDAIRARAEAFDDAWGWHEQTDDTLAGHGHHMSQMLYRLPRDGQTDDMKASIEGMLTDVPALLARADLVHLGRQVALVAEGTGFTTEVYGVKIAKCDDRGRTEADIRAEKAEAELAAAREALARVEAIHGRIHWCFGGEPQENGTYLSDDVYEPGTEWWPCPTLAALQPATDEGAGLPLHRTEAGYPSCSTCDGGGCLDCTDPA